MNTTNLLSVRFFIKQHKMKDGRVPIYVRICVQGKPADVSLKRNIEIAHWNKKKGEARGSLDDAKSINANLERIRTEITNAYGELKFQKKEITAEAVKNMWCGIKQEEHTLLSLVEYHNTSMMQILEWGTMKNYFTTQRYLERFLKQIKKTSDEDLSRLSYSFLIDFEIYLKGLKPGGQRRPCGHNAVLKHIERLRKMVNLAVKNEWIQRNPFARFQPRFIRNDREFLSQDELIAIEAKQFHIYRLQCAKDLFVFSCYTGLSYCDLMTLKKENISIGIDGEYWIVTARKKTSQTVRIPLLPKAMELIEKYKGDPKAIATGTAFPKLTNQKLNAYLKEIADLCGITKNLTFHLARHTFATTVTLTNGVPVETVSKMLGHTSIRTTQIYAKVIERKVSEDMKGLKKRLVNQEQQTRIGSK
jgi:integrase